MFRFLIYLFFGVFFSLRLEAQVHYASKLETSFYKYDYCMIKIEPGPNWKGYNLEKRVNGFEFNWLNGIRFAQDRLFAGIGLGYLNFEGIHGYSTTFQFDYVLFKKMISPVVGIRFGNDRIYNQYVGGTKTGLLECVGGIDLKCKKHAFYLCSGILFTQQVQFIPFKVGFRF